MKIQVTEQRYKDSDITLWGNAEPVCPYCGSEQETTDLNGMFDDFKDEDTIQTECDNCEKEFFVELNMPVRYNSFANKK